MPSEKCRLSLELKPQNLCSSDRRTRMRWVMCETLDGVSKGKTPSESMKAAWEKLKTACKEVA